MNISFSRILPVYDCIHNADISDLVKNLSVESKRPRKQERDVVPCTKVHVSFEDPLWFMHKRHSLQVEGARGGGIPQLQISASKYEVADAPNPQPLKFVPIKNLKTGVVHLAAFIANLPRRIRDN